MDWLTQQIASHKVPIGGWSARFIDWLTDNFAWFFDAVADSIEYSIEGVIALLVFAPPLVLIALIAALVYWLHRSAWLAASIALMLLFIINLGFWEETLETLALIVSAALLCMVAGVPIGIAAARSALQPSLDPDSRVRLVEGAFKARRRVGFALGAGNRDLHDATEHAIAAKVANGAYDRLRAEHGLPGELSPFR